MDIFLKDLILILNNMLFLFHYINVLEEYEYISKFIPHKCNLIYKTSILTLLQSTCNYI